MSDFFEGWTGADKCGNRLSAVIAEWKGRYSLTVNALYEGGWTRIYDDWFDSAPAARRAMKRRGIEWQKNEGGVTYGSHN